MERYADFSPTPLNNYYETLSTELALEQRRRVAVPNLGGLGVKSALESAAIRGAEGVTSAIGTEAANFMALVVGAPAVANSVERPQHSLAA